MRPEKYDDKSSRAHIKRFVDILEKAPVLTNTVAKKEKPRSRSNSQASEEAKTPEPVQDEKVKKAYEDLLSVIKSHENDTVKEVEKEKPTQAISIFKEIFRNPISTSSLNKLKHVKCLESFNFAASNPVTADRKLQGDLFYLSVRTLDSPAEFGLTCTANGFFHNSSTASTFNPAPAKTSACFSYTLVGCIHQLSASFGRNLETYLNSILRTDAYFLTPLQRPFTSWITNGQESTGMSVSSNDNLGQTVVPLYGLDPKQLRDWNEEF